MDQRGNGFADKNDVLRFCQAIGVPITHNEVDYLFVRYDLDNDGRLSYSDYLEMITPFESEYVHLLNSRQPKNTRNQATYFELYSPQSKDDIKNLWLFMIDTERKLAFQRESLTALTKPSLKRLFNEIDIKNRRLINRSELAKYLNYNEAPISGRELSFLIRRMDRDSDELLSFTDFCQEFALQN